MQRSLRCITLMVILLAITPPAAAHYDVHVYDGTVELEPNASVTFVEPLHYHRLVGNLEADEDAQLELWAHVPGHEPERIAGPAANIAVNHFFRCCDDAAWTPVNFTVLNVASAPVKVEMRLVLLHDGFAVSMFNAEGGAVSTSLITFSALAGGFAWASRRPSTELPRPRDSMEAAEGGAWVLITAWVLILVVAGIGMVRFGGGPAAGTLTATSVLPVKEFEITWHLAFIAMMFVLWVISLRLWMVAHRRQGPTPSRWLRVLDAGHIIGPLAITITLIVEYGRLTEAVAIAVFPIAFLFWGAYWPRAKIPSMV